MLANHSGNVGGPSSDVAVTGKARFPLPELTARVDG